MVCRSAKRTLRHLAFALPLTLFVLFAHPVRAQSFDASHLREPANLAVKWLVEAGDNSGYASADFDDSHWTLFDPSGSIESLFPHHPDVVWYRLHVKVDPTQTGLALSEIKLSRAFEIYVNGERLIASGQVAPYVPYTSDARVLARIPDRVLASGAIVI